jgi:hypothetical protein
LIDGNVFARGVHGHVLKIFTGLDAGCMNSLSRMLSMYIGWYIGWRERNLTGSDRRVQDKTRSSFARYFPIAPRGRFVPPCGINPTLYLNKEAA